MKNETKQGSRKAPRTHNPAWKDATRNTRQQKRRKMLDHLAWMAGWDSWSRYETAVLNQETNIKKNPAVD